MCWCVIEDVSVGVWEFMFYLLTREFGMFVKGGINWIDVTICVELLVYLYISVLVTNRRALFCVIINLYLVGNVRELRGTVGVGYARAGRMVVLYNLSLLCWLRPENFLCFERRCSTSILFLVA